jgi:hypothetical protein
MEQPTDVLWPLWQWMLLQDTGYSSTVPLNEPLQSLLLNLHHCGSPACMRLPECMCKPAPQP